MSITAFEREGNVRMAFTPWLQQPVARQLSGRHLLTLRDMQPEEITWLLDFALALKAAGVGGARNLLKGRTLALLFEKPSTRTRISFEVAMWQLGGLGLYLNTQDLQMPRGETVEDTSRVLSRYVQGIVIRTHGHERLESFAAASTVPVINGLSDRFHPCQVLADLLTLKERFERLEGLHLVYVGDGNNMAHSLAIGGAKVGMRVTLCTPEGYDPDPQVMAVAEETARATGGSVELCRDPREVVGEADALYTDVWVSMGQEEEQQERRAAFKGYTIDAVLMARAPRHAIVLHCLPAHRGEEITGEVLDGPASAVWDQAENRLHAQKAVLAALLTNRA